MADRGGPGYAAFLAGLVAAMAALQLSKGGFYIARHEGDTLHMLEIVLRMMRGDWPHLDFVTPIGIFAFLPMLLFIWLGFGIGMAFLLGQFLVALLVLPGLWWVGMSRFRGAWRYLFGAVVLTLVLALVHGETQIAVSVSMQYNRWAWAVAFLVIATALLPARRGQERPLADGAVIGLAMAVLALLKVTYFVGFAPAVLVALLAGRRWRELRWALVLGGAVAALVTLAGGPGFWAAYLGDLLQVRGSDIRPQPSASFGAVIGAPAYLAGSLLAVLSVVLLRQSGRLREGLVMLLLAPGFFYVSFQNYANDPQWLALLALLLWMLPPADGATNAPGLNLRRAGQFAAVAALALAAPSYLNLAYSPIRHLVADPADYRPVLPGSPWGEDLQTARIRARQITAEVPLDGPDTPFAAVTDADLREGIWQSFQGEPLPACSLKLGTIAWFSAAAADLRASGLAEGRTVFAADLLSSYWLFGAFEPLPGGAPWYYGGLPGFENADYLIVPLCPLALPVRRMVLEEVARSGVTLREVRRTEIYILYRK